VDGETAADRLIASFERWAASERGAEQAAARSRTTSLARQAAATATWVGVLIDLAEQASAVAVTVGSTRLTGRLVGVGLDFCVLEPDRGCPALIRVDAISTLSPLSPVSAPTASLAPGGQREPALALGLPSVLEGLTAERAALAVHAGAILVEGEMVAFGEDVLTLRAITSPRRVTHIPLDAITYCELR